MFGGKQVGKQQHIAKHKHKHKNNNNRGVGGGHLGSNDVKGLIQNATDIVNLRPTLRLHHKDYF